MQIGINCSIGPTSFVFIRDWVLCLAPLCTAIQSQSEAERGSPLGLVRFLRPLRFCAAHSVLEPHSVECAVGNDCGPSEGRQEGWDGTRSEREQRGTPGKVIDGRASGVLFSQYHAGCKEEVAWVSKRDRESWFH